MHIGNFTLAKEGGWIGYIHTLTINAKIRLVPNNNNADTKAPTFRILHGNLRIGDAWESITQSDQPKNYLHLRIDDPLFPEPINAALFSLDNGSVARLIWNRKKDG